MKQDHQHKVATGQVLAIKTARVSLLLLGRILVESDTGALSSQLFWRPGGQGPCAGNFLLAPPGVGPLAVGWEPCAPPPVVAVCQCLQSPASAVLEKNL
jgi:hypothetical protein